MLATNRQLLESGLVTLGIAFDPDRLDRLVGYHDALMAQNRVLNLTGHEDEGESVVKNLLNALGPWRHFKPEHPSCDIGSGGGVIGVSLAIMCDLRMTLIESKQKKCAFLDKVVRVFSPSTRVLCADAAEVSEPFAQVTACGFGTLDKLLRVSRRCMVPGGCLLAYKGRREKIDEEIAACPRGAGQWSIHPFTVPGLEAGAQRHLVKYRS